jgi:hypothetical protein
MLGLSGTYVILRWKKDGFNTIGVEEEGAHPRGELHLCCTTRKIIYFSSTYVLREGLRPKSP